MSLIEDTFSDGLKHDEWYCEGCGKHIPTQCRCEASYQPKFPKRESRKKPKKRLQTKTPLKRSGRVKTSQHKLESQAETQEIVNAYMAKEAQQPCFIFGANNERKEVAHIHMPKRMGLATLPRLEHHNITPGEVYAYICQRIAAAYLEGWL